MNAGEGGEQPRLTIRVRHLDKAGKVIGRRPEIRVMGGERPSPYELSSVMAPCQCKRCKPIT